jgi:glycosyltransferase involved in cell wall biosynthesis
VDPRPRIVCALQLPPPLHGVTAMNAQLVASEALQCAFELDVVPLQFSTTVAELGRVNARKLVHAGIIAARLAHRFAGRPAAFYITLAPQRPAIARDAAYLALARAARIPRIVHLHARPDPDVLPVLRRALRGATVILLARTLRADLGDAVTDAQLRYVPNGIPDPGEIVRALRPAPRVLFLANLLPAKGPLVLVAALGELARRGVAFEATFAGAPSREIGAEQLRAAIAAAGIADRAHYVGAVDPGGRAALFRDHDVFVLPTAREAFGLVVLEAMAAGLPVVATREGALPELVVDGETGLLVDRDRLADPLARLLADPGERARMGRRGRERFLAHFTAAQFERQLVGVFAEAAGA